IGGCLAFSLPSLVLNTSLLTSPFQFTQTVYNTTIYENSAAKSYVECPIKMGIYITDPSWDIQYKIESGDGEALFKAEEYVLGDFSFLRIRTKGGSSAILNREVKERYSLRVKALKWSTKAVAQTRVQVRVLDTNDLRPLFSPTSYSVSVRENAAIRTSIVRVTATDADVGTNAEYYFSLGGEHNDMFAIHPTSGVITLMARLDYAERRLFEMDVLAVDRGMKLYGSSGFSSTAKLTVRVLQANEHAPILTAVPLAPSDTDTDPTYALVTVEDNDQGPNGEIASLSIVAGDPLQQFRAVKTSPGGKQYRVKAIKDVDWDSCQFGCNLTLQAEDKGSPPQFSSAEVIRVRSPRVDVRAPAFEKNIYRVNLTEFAPPNTSVVMVRAMPNHPMLKYSIKYPKIQPITNPFTINSNTGLITTTAAIQADRASKYDFEVVINQEQASTRVVINVIDVNNNAPVFQQLSYKGNVNENVPVGTSILTVSASDMDEGENGYVTYTIANVNPPQPFTIGYFTGVISTARELDYERMPRVYNLRVRASDWGSPFCREVETPVSITLNNLNDNEPLFEKVDCEVSLPRYYRVGEQIAAVSAIDADDLEVVQYVILDGNSLGLFDLTPDTGVLSLKLPLHDGEAARLSFHSLQISANDGETSSKPMFVNITVLSGSGAVFEQCVDTGVVGRMAEKLLLGTMPHSQREDHFEDIHSINNYSPHFVDSTPKVIEVKEDLQVGMRIAHLSAIDADSGFSGTLMFVISGGDVESRFMIEMDTGWLKIMEPLDREITDQYTLNITVYDLGIPQRSASHVLQINVLDSNDNSPNFLQNSYSVSISEDTDVGIAVIQVDATDKDSGANRIIRYSLMVESDHFVIDDQTGVVKVKSPLDRELNPTIILKVVACDQAVDEPQMISTVSLKIVLEDVNDNPPRFFPLHQRVKVREDLPLGAVVVWLQAHDPDQGQSGQVHFSLLDDGDGDFDVDKTNGAVRILRTLDFERRQVYNLTARAKDKGKPESLSCTCFIEVYVVDVDENLHQPRFASFVDKGSVREDAPIGTTIMTVTAQDNDQGRDGEIRYSIRDGSGLGVFTIDEESDCRITIHVVTNIFVSTLFCCFPFTGNEDNSFAIDLVLGTITVAKELDRDDKSQFELAVKASDRGVPPLSAVTTVRIAVTVPDNARPRFPEEEISAVISETVPVGSLVTLVSASSHSSVLYQIREGNVNNAFDINPTSGFVVTQRLLDYESVSSYRLTVQATNMAEMMNYVTVLIHLRDENDNSPVFTQTEFRGVVSESAPVNSMVLTNGKSPLVIQATDADSDLNGRLVYQIVEPYALDYFAIDSSTGAIRTVTGLDYEQRSEFNFTVQVHDSGRPQLFSEIIANVNIHITDVNDCPPTFSQDVFETSVIVPTYSGVKVISINATDLDSGAGSKLLFSISDGNIGGQFMIDPKSGVISVLNPAQLRNGYELTVRVSDGKFTKTAMVKVNIRENQNKYLAFAKDLYTASLPENLSERKTLAVVTAARKRLNEPLFYTILNPQGRFEIGHTSGVLFTTGVPFDREEQDTFEIVVEVTKEHISSGVAHALVVVTIEDVNDNEPVFVGLPYSALVQLDSAEGQVVRHITTVDKDTGRNAEIKYQLKEDWGYFQISPSGEISLKRTIHPKDVDTKFAISVIAKDRGDPSLSATVEVTVTVVSKAVPVFEKSSYDIVISEDVPLDTSIVKIQANALEGPRTVYSIFEGDPLGQFSISFITGVFHVVQPLDYETHPAYRLSIRASDSLTGAHSEVFLDIILEDVNDNAPTFKERLYEASVPESAGIDSSVLQVSATDSDSGNNKVLFYQLVEEGGGSSDYFTIDQDSGVIMTSGLLDYEVGPQHRLVVRAVDGGVPAQSSEVPVIISVTDINDNPPVFTQHLYKAMVSQLAQRDHFVACVRTSDADLSDTDRLEYSLLSGNEDSSFTIDGRSGEIVISKYRKLNRETLYNLSVSVSDGLYSSVCNVQVTVVTSNLHSPFFSHTDSVVELLENSPVGTLVTQVTATDKDPGVYGKVTYYIVNDVAKDKFTINENGEIFTVESLDRENVISSLISISLMAKDGGGKLGFTSVNVILTDVNDNAPQFRAAEYKANIPRDVSEGTIIVRVTAVDADEGSNADITYTVESEVGGFDIHPLNGDIIGKDNFTAYKNDLFSFYVSAKDTGDPPKKTVVPVYIRLLPKEVTVPKLVELQKRWSVSEDLHIGSEIDVIQESEQLLIYSLVKGSTTESNQDQVFVVNTDTGKLKLAKRLDFETTKWYLLTLQAQSDLEDIDVITTAQLHIQVQDVNDNSPQFESDSYRSFVVENLPKGTSVIQVRATDLDSGVNGQITYSLDQYQNSVEVLGMFAVDGESGWVTTLKELDREQQDRYSVAVLATDRGHDGRLYTAATVEVTVVDVNDNPMRFMAEVFRASVSEDIPVPSRAIAVLRTTDRDSEDLNKPICCFITGGDPRAQFDLEHSQGEWRVVVRRALDREERDSYLLNVTASDGTFVTTATVEISVLDANDNSPVCERALYAQTVPENTPEGRLVLQVSATDADIQSNAQISYTLSGDGADYFSIESDTGRLRTLLPLDREERDVYSLLVQAEDGGQRYCQANVVITVGDVNDNAPEFTAGPYPVTVFENTEINTYVARLQATDLDAENNSRILYSFEDSADGRFSIQQHSGLVRVERPLVRTQAGYTLRVRATDQGSPRRLSSVCSVLVSVLSANDRPPAFQNRDYGVTVSEDVTLGTPVVRVFAASGYPKATADIAYSIVNGNEHGMFSMDSHTGDIFVTKALDYEASHEHYLTVQASDKGRTSQGDIATVTIYLTDVNDNSPVFSQEVYSAVISEDTDMGLTMLTVMADDIDGPSNNHIHFSIIKGNQAGPFTIDTVSGEVKVVCPLDREKVAAYTLTVLASDSGSPSRSSSALINIDVSDVNDNAPLFSEANYSLVIQESVPVGTSVLKLTVTDRDASHNGPPFSFTILGGDEGGSFLIDPQGTLRTTTLLDRTVKDHYILHAQVLDSGRPPILTSTVINIRVIQESLHPPAILPLEVLISTPGEAYPGGVLGQIQATDQDLYDSLTYNLQPNLSNTLLFSLSPSDGRLVTRPGHVLKLGHYLLNVTVTDGRFTTATGVSVHVHQVTKRMLESSVAVRLAGVGPEEFVGEHWRGFLRALRMVAGIKRSDVQLVSLQPCEPPGSLDVLLALERSPPGNPLTTTKDGILLRKLNASVGAIQEVTGLRVVRVFRKLCAGLDCPVMLCSEMVTLDQNVLTTYSTARLSLITPPHHRSAVCLCKGGECPVLKQLCEGKPCPEGCVSNQREGPYSCVCPPDQQGGCSGTSLWFSGKGYIRYRLMENRYREEMKLSLRLRTLSHHATLLFARGTDYCILEIVDGRLQYQFDCGSGPGIVSIHSAQVSDGQWHIVSLEVNGNHAMLVLDQLYTASGTAPGTLRSLNLDGSLLLGGVSESDQQRAAKTVSQHLPVSHSRDLQGCMEAVRFNGYDLNLDTEAQAHVLVEEVVGVAPGCGALPVPDCSSKPCVNGGTCSTLPHGGYFCKCSDLFMGSHCEVAASPCSSNPCLYGGTCVLDNQDFYCQCRGQYSGPRCLGDVDECMQTESLCSNGGVCVNTYGSFNCSCVVGFAGRQCELEVLVRNELLFTSWSIGLEEFLGLALFLVTVFGLSLLFVVVRKRAKQDRSEEYEVSYLLSVTYLEVKSSRGVPVYLDVPPQIPIRPISYTPSYPSNSRHNLNKGSCEGLGLVEPTEHSTPDPVPMLRRGVAVCSVAPTLPRRPHSNTPSETESIQKPCWDYHYDEKVVELDPVSTQRSRKDLENRGSASESLCSYQSGSGDENGRFLYSSKMTG
uniref:FAT atypical cadherin 1 n=1 Tax=Hucho hucho TaxID=62062 RepID=A0A4W5PG36_9TELE